MTAPTTTPIIDDLMRASGIPPEDECYDLARRGLEHLLGEALLPCALDSDPRDVLDEVCADFDRRIGAQIDEILHDSRVVALESAWRTLHLLVDRVDHTAGVRIELLNCSREDLEHDLQDAPTLSRSGLWSVIRRPLDVLGGQPYALVLGGYEFNASTADVVLLDRVAQVMEAARAVFLAAPGPWMFGAKKLSELPSLRDLPSLFEGPNYARWGRFRETDHARFVALCLPRFALRERYDIAGNLTRFGYREDPGAERCWGSAAVVLALSVARSFARSGWPAEFTGTRFGYLPDLPVRGIVETRASARREIELGEAGFVTLLPHDAGGGGVFLTATTCRARRSFGGSAEGIREERDFAAANCLANVLLECRVAHLVAARRRDAGGLSDAGFVAELAEWLEGLTRSERSPLARAGVVFRPKEGEGERPELVVHLQPRASFEGEAVTVSSAM